MADNRTKVLINGKEVDFVDFNISRQGGRIVDSANVRLPFDRQVSQWSRVEIVQDKVSLNGVQKLFPLTNSTSDESGNRFNAEQNVSFEFINGRFGNGIYMPTSSQINLITDLPFSEHCDISFWMLVNGAGSSFGGFLTNGGVLIQENRENPSDNNNSNISFGINSKNEIVFFTNYHRGQGGYGVQSFNVFGSGQWVFVRLTSFIRKSNDKRFILELNGQQFLLGRIYDDDFTGFPINISVRGYTGSAPSQDIPILQSKDVNAQTLTLWGKYLLDGNLNDTSGNSRNLIGSGSLTYVAGKYGNAVRCTNGASVKTQQITQNSSWDLCYWMNISANIAHYIGGGRIDIMNLQKLTSGNSNIYLYSHGGNNSLGFSIPANQWVFVRCSYDTSNNKTLTVNIGSNTYTRANTNFDTSRNSEFWFGGLSTAINQFDNIAIKNGGLFTDDEVAEIKNNFTPVDTTKPTLSSAVYTTGNGVITLTFSENIKTVDRTKFTFTAGNATMSLPVATINGNVITATFASGNQSILNGAASITLSLDSGAVTDNADNVIDASSDIVVTKQDTKRPTLLNTSFYTRLTGVLTLNFSENISSITTQNIIIRDNNFTAVNLPSVKTITNNVVTVTLSATDRAKFNNSDSMTISIPANTASDVSGNMNVAITNMALSISGDKINPVPEDRPVLQNAFYYSNTNSIELVFDDTIGKIQPSSITVTLLNRTGHTLYTYTPNPFFDIKRNRVFISLSGDNIGSILPTIDVEQLNSPGRLQIRIPGNTITGINGQKNNSITTDMIHRKYRVPNLFYSGDEKTSYGLHIKNVRVRNNSRYDIREIQTIVSKIEPTSFMKFGGRVQRIERNKSNTLLKCQSYGSEISRADTLTQGTNTSPENIIEQAITQDTVSLNFVNIGGASNVTLGNFKNRGKLIDNIKKLANVGNYDFTTDGVGNFILYKNNRRIFPIPLIHGEHTVSILKDLRNDQTFRNSVQGTIPVTEDTGQNTFHVRIQPYGNFRYNPSSNGTEIPSTIDIGKPVTSIARIYARWSAAGLYDISNSRPQYSKSSATNFLNSSQYSISGQTVTIGSTGKQKLMPNRIPQSINADYIDLRVDMYIEFNSTQTVQVDVRGISQRGFSNIQSSVGTPSYLTESDILKNIETGLVNSFDIEKSITVTLGGLMPPYMEGDIICVVNDRKNINGNYVIKTVNYNYATGLTKLLCNEFEFSDIDDRDDIITTINELGNAVNETNLAIPRISVLGETMTMNDKFTFTLNKGDKIPALYDTGRYDESRYGVGEPINQHSGNYDDVNSTYDGTTTYGSK